MDSKQVLKQFFGYDSFRAGQESIINAIMANQDILAVMPTGAGKSICYQIPAMMLDGITLVISPLISLMQDQVTALQDAGIKSAFINSALSDSKISEILSMAEKGCFKLIYIAPERLESHRFLEFALKANISMITIDEAHCISQWGQDFRPSYLKILDFIKQLPSRPIISAFTATATEEVRNDIICTLNLNNPHIQVSSFDRPNLYFSVKRNGNKESFISSYITKHKNESGIIYCSTRKKVDTLHEMLVEAGINATRYHAGLDNETRKKNQDDFIYDRCQIIVATNAFGMGIDKSNVRFVIHFNMPQSMENYYQEAGRAGRDGENSDCILLYSDSDVITCRFLLEHKKFDDVPPEDIEAIKQRDKERLRIMQDFCKNKACLRNFILDYFGEKREANCDNCSNCQKTDFLPKAVSKQVHHSNKDDLTENGLELFEKLRQLRMAIARKEAMPPYIVFSDQTLADMCKKLPRNEEEMLNVSGVGKKKYAKYGSVFLDTISEFTSKNPSLETVKKQENHHNNKPLEEILVDEAFERFFSSKHICKYRDECIDDDDCENGYDDSFLYLDDLQSELDSIFAMSRPPLPVQQPFQ